MTIRHHCRILFYCFIIRKGDFECILRVAPHRGPHFFGWLFTRYPRTRGTVSFPYQRCLFTEKVDGQLCWLGVSCRSC